MKNAGTLTVTTPSAREIALTRVFDAPRRLVFEAFTRPELLKRWFGPRGFTLIDCEIDYRVGGGFRFVLRNPGGSEVCIRGVYKELDPPKRSVHLESFRPHAGYGQDDVLPGAESQVTTLLVEYEGKTALTATVLYPSQEARDAVIQSGMEHGAAESYDRLAEVLTVLDAPSTPTEFEHDNS